ncbi:MAG TPA: hypothetical protein VHK91_06760, partial [Flavisolibacter sp.]|nr:hypothetical protein [Flavisolibacter sp.]
MKLVSLLTLTFSVLTGYAQESPYSKFGKITVADLQKKVYSIDSGAKAVVLSDIGEIAIQGNSKGWFSALITRHRVVHILNKNGYDMADISIPLYNDKDDEERLDYVKAVSYNLENGKIVETKLDKNTIFKEKESKNLSYKKFTMPAVKEG